MPSLHEHQLPRGFALLDAIIASALAATIAAGSSIILAMSIRASHEARTRTVAAVLAARKMEQLKSLAWTHISTGTPAISMSLSDLTTNLSTDPSTDDGPGLLPSPPGSLSRNVDGYADYLDGSGVWIGGGATTPAAAVFIRRWSVQAYGTDPDNLLIFEVVAGARGSNGGLSAEAVHLVSMEARK
jgi:hypothetical protein